MSLKIIIYKYWVEHEISRGQREKIRKKTIIYNNLESNKSLKMLDLYLLGQKCLHLTFKPY